MILETKGLDRRQARQTLASKRPCMTVSTPCIRVCILDPETGLCEGCGRTMEEITSWYRLGEDERLKIMATLEERMRRAFAAEPEEAR
jgi:predicted Fe-S protein YdhL (DUF1289 family)